MPNVENWVDDRLASLDAGSDAQPNAASILSRVHTRERMRVRRNRLLGTVLLGSLTCLGLAAVVTFRTPDIPPPPPVVPAQISAQPVEVPRIIPSRPVPAPMSNSVAIATLVPHNYKESGWPTAPATLEIYSDYECPPCATFFAETLPLLVSQYVDTGKLKLLRRDFPLPQHKYANLAARYANAAGMLGQYQAVSEQIFRTQPEWHQDGDVDRQVAAVVSPELMQKLRDLVNNNTEPAESIARDRAIGADDHLQQTPGFVLVANGKRQTFNGPFTELKPYLEEMLRQ